MLSITLVSSNTKKHIVLTWRRRKWSFDGRIDEIFAARWKLFSLTVTKCKWLRRFKFQYVVRNSESKSELYPRDILMLFCFTSGIWQIIIKPNTRRNCTSTKIKQVLWAISKLSTPFWKNKYIMKQICVRNRQKALEIIYYRQDGSWFIDQNLQKYCFDQKLKNCFTY